MTSANGWHDTQVATGRVYGGFVGGHGFLCHALQKRRESAHNHHCSCVRNQLSVLSTELHATWNEPHHPTCFPTTWSRKSLCVPAATVALYAFVGASNRFDSGAIIARHGGVGTTQASTDLLPRSNLSQGSRSETNRFHKHGRDRPSSRNCSSHLSDATIGAVQDSFVGHICNGRMAKKKIIIGSRLSERRTITSRFMACPRFSGCRCKVLRIESSTTALLYGEDNIILIFGGAQVRIPTAPFKRPEMRGGVKVNPKVIPLPRSIAHLHQTRRGRSCFLRCKEAESHQRRHVCARERMLGKNGHGRKYWCDTYFAALRSTGRSK